MVAPSPSTIHSLLITYLAAGITANAAMYEQSPTFGFNNRCTTTCTYTLLDNLCISVVCLDIMLMHRTGKPK